MDIAARKWTITEQLALVTDEELLERIQHLLSENLGGDDLTLAELDELDAQELARSNGSTIFFSREEAIRRVREGFKE